MDERTIDTTLDTVERRLASGQTADLRALGFWRAVNAVKRDPALATRYGERIGRIDRDAFRRAIRTRLPAAIGVALLVAGFIVGLALLAIGATLAHPWRELAILVGFGALDTTTHGLAHFVVGTAVGIRFTDWFVDLPKKPQPGLKIDYASYLRTPPRSRAWMHASGAIVTKITPFAVLVYATSAGAEWWAGLILAAVGALQIVSDALFSVKTSDWKKYRREMKLAQAS